MGTPSTRCTLRVTAFSTQTTSCSSESSITAAWARKASYTETVSAVLPPLVDGAYHVIILVDSRGLAADTDRSNNTGVSTQAIALSVPSLEAGVPVASTTARGGPILSSARGAGL